MFGITDMFTGVIVLLMTLLVISVGGDLRALFQVVDGTIVIYEMIGTHSQLYG